MLKNVELRKLPAGSLCRITQILETNGDWKKVMSLIPKRLDEETTETKYNNEHMRVIEDYAKQTNRNCAEILFDEWGTSGKVRPTLGILQEIIMKAGIYKAADEIAKMLKEPLPPRPKEGPAAPIDTGITELLNSTKKKNQTESTAQMKSSGFPNLQKMLRSLGTKSTQQAKTDSNYDSYNGIPNIPDFGALMPSQKHEKQLSDIRVPYQRNMIKIDSTILKNKQLTRFEYNELEDITSQFSNELIHGPCGPTGKIGSGGFGDVYAGFHKQHGTLAIKKIRVRDPTWDKQDPDFIARTFNSEVMFLAKLRHENIVPIIGYSIHMEASIPSLCIVCQYIDGGSLDQNLAAKRLNGKQRIDIMLGTAMGLKYIHNSEVTDPSIGEEEKVKLLHGDVKSANILLTRDFKPKLCDFGLAKQFNTTMMTENLTGTRAYMSLERIRGMITQKSDVYSFGVVLLEILTGLQCNVKCGSEIINIKDYMRLRAPTGEVSELLDPVVGPWSVGQAVYGLAQKCLVEDYILRQPIDAVCDGLQAIADAAGD